jgi:hypothetical protein
MTELANKTTWLECGRLSNVQLTRQYFRLSHMRFAICNFSTHYHKYHMARSKTLCVVSSRGSIAKQIHDASKRQIVMIDKECTCSRTSHTDSTTSTTYARGQRTHQLQVNLLELENPVNKGQYGNAALLRLRRPLTKRIYPGCVGSTCTKHVYTFTWRKTSIGATPSSSLFLYLISLQHSLPKVPLKEQSRTLPHPHSLDQFSTSQHPNLRNTIHLPNMPSRLPPPQIQHTPFKPLARP